MSDNSNLLKKIAADMFKDLDIKDTAYRIELLDLETVLSYSGKISSMLSSLITEEIAYCEKMDAVFAFLPEEGYNVNTVRSLANRTYGAFKGHELCGIASYSGDTKSISNVYVEPEHRGKGLARKLVETVLENNNVVNVFVVPTNKPAVALYKKLGFKVIPSMVMELKK